MTTLKIEKGLFFVEENGNYVIPAMNENTNGDISFEELISPYLQKEMIGDYEIVARFEPVNMSLGDSYGIYIYSGENHVYLSFNETAYGRKIKTGVVDFMEAEYPSVKVDCDTLYLKIAKSDDIYETLYSPDGIEFVSCGKISMESDIVTRAGFKVDSFQGSKFYVKLSDIKVE